MKIVFIGCVEFSSIILKHVLSFKNIEIVGIITKRESVKNADFCSLEPLALKASLPCLFSDESSHSDMVLWLKRLEPDIIYCFGWPHLLKKEILSIPRLGVIGYHPASLPKNRGRHPIIWALALGLKETASTFFFMDEGIDSGDIINQKIIEIEQVDNASTLYKKIINAGVGQISIITEELVSNIYTRTPQDHSIANCWRKRNKIDGQIDWRMTAAAINDLVRALTRPYPGAHCIYRDDEVKIWKVEVVGANLINIEPGKILSIEGTNIFVKCGEGILKLIEHEFKYLPRVGSYL